MIEKKRKYSSLNNSNESQIKVTSNIELGLKENNLLDCSQPPIFP